MGLILTTLANAGQTVLGGVGGAALGSAMSVLADSWLEFYSCDSIPDEVLVVRAKRQMGKGQNFKGNDKVITDGSGIVVQEGQAAILVDQGMVVEVATDPGIYKYETGTSPSIFSSSLGAGLKNTFKEMWDRIKHGGEAAKDQRIYYVNTKELMNNRFGSANPIPFRLTYPELGRSFTVEVRCNGQYSFRITDPVLFYANVCGNVANEYLKETILPQLKSEFIDALTPAFATFSAQGIRYDELPAKQKEAKEALSQELDPEWKQKRGISIEKVAFNPLTVSEADKARIQDFEDRAWNRDPRNAIGTLVEGQHDSMIDAANNANGAMNGIFATNMMQNNASNNLSQLFNMANQQDYQQQQMQMQQQQMQMQQQQMQQQAAPAPAAPAADSWKCECGAVNTGKFCTECGKTKPAPAAADGWTCSCGAVNKGKFCMECGKPKPAGAPLYKCDKCGWEPEDPKNPPKFCPQCGDPFDDSDIVK